MQGEGGGSQLSANEYTCAHGWSPNKLWRSNSILNLCPDIMLEEDVGGLVEAVRLSIETLRLLRKCLKRPIECQDVLELT
jgi:hypothetical protein